MAGIIARRAHFLVSVDGRAVTRNFLPILLSVSITKGTDQTADSVRFDLDDRGGTLRWPETGTPVHVELGREGGAIRTFDGEVDTPSWALSRTGGAVLSVSARSVSLRGKAKQPAEKHWEKKPLSAILEEAGKEAGVTMSVHGDFASVVPDWEAMDAESFISFGERLAREHGAIFRIEGSRGVFVPYGSSVSGAGLSTITVTRERLISASGFSPVTDRPRIKQKVETYYDLDEAKRLAERYASGDSVEADDQTGFSAADKETAKRRAKAGSKKANRDKGSGSVTIDGDATGQPGGKAILSGLRAGVDGTYTITSVTDELSRSSGYTTALSLGEPSGSAGMDAR
ncbi:phage late control D family protein [Ciceribacter ferrooxidans]|uniref:Late control protein n=1 Tax=Ciceribacter ferrooxidans TaxID=2509717 RepID=A0A4Q2SVT1_9HYPH|nr:late control protein [Ciceribacter ferrooxidans]RYC10185.1 late control protein [Ciceribacter ferrooxidans]